VEAHGLPHAARQPPHGIAHAARAGGAVLVGVHRRRRWLGRQRHPLEPPPPRIGERPLRDPEQPPAQRLRVAQRRDVRERAQGRFLCHVLGEVRIAALHATPRAYVLEMRNQRLRGYLCLHHGLTRSKRRFGVTASPSGRP
jgi:hypothetical protein